MSADIVVVGSINQDLTVITERHPSPGETVLGHLHHAGGGGKGANQAVAAARLGNSVAMIGRVGDDDSGRSRLAQLEAEGIDISGVALDPEAPTGLAVITLDNGGENTIVVSPGANMKLSVADVSRCEALLSSARVVLAQLEVPLETVTASTPLTNGMFLLNPAPARALPAELLASVDVLIPNQSELAVFVDETFDSGEDVAVAASTIKGPGAIVVTLGGSGCVVIEDDAITKVSAPAVQVVDTTGAGDAFCGALADGLNRGLPLGEAAEWGTRVGAAAVIRPGAQDAMPTATEVERIFGG